MMHGLEGRTALVTGGGGGIGWEIALAFAQAEAAVVVADRDLDQVHRRISETDDELRDRFHAVPLDVRDPQSIVAARDAALAIDGRLDILVNSAGVIDEASVADMTDEQWSRTIDVNLTGVFRTCRAVIAPMVAQRWGRIITIASQVGQKGGARLAHYTASKAGVIGFSKALARELAPHGITVNCIAPGPVDTGFDLVLDEQTRTGTVGNLPIPRPGHTNEVAPSALLLASTPGGNLYVGQTLGPNCGDVML